MHAINTYTDTGPTWTSNFDTHATINIIVNILSVLDFVWLKAVVACDSQSHQ